MLLFAGSLCAGTVLAQDLALPTTPAPLSEAELRARYQRYNIPWERHELQQRHWQLRCNHLFSARESIQYYLSHLTGKESKREIDDTRFSARLVEDDIRVWGC